MKLFPEVDISGMSRKTLAWLAVLLLALHATLASGDEHAFSRANFGNHALPTWTPLTDFEWNTLESVRSNKSDPDTLLALYLLASGDVRTWQDFAPYKRALDDFLTLNASRLRAQDERTKGKELLAAMHRHFFAGTGDDPETGAYALNQSALTGIFHTQTYNCISSALLYAALASRLGLQPAGVVMPSHAFVQLALSNGERVEVETTSPAGFDVVRDSTFYQGEAAAWFSDRQLVPANFEDYQQRRVVSAVELGLENLVSQHISADRMTYPDRMRLAELKGALQPADYLAQHNRLFYYYSEASYLRGQNDDETFLKLFTHIEPYLQTLEVLARSTEALADREFQTLFLLVQAARAKALIESGEPAAGLRLARHALQTLDLSVREIHVITSDLYQALAAYTVLSISEGRFDEARAAFSGLEADCQSQANCVHAMDRLYAQWAGSFWEEQDWQGAIAIYRDYLSLGLLSENAVNFESNLESAYINLANQAWYDEDHDTALDYLSLCETEIDTAQRCSQRRKEMERAFQ